MKKTTSIILSGILTLSAMGTVFAENDNEEILLTSAAPQTAYTLTVNNDRIDAEIYSENNHIMVPLRALSEMLGFAVTWDDNNKSIVLDNKTVKTSIIIGQDRYYMSASPSTGLIGMSAPSPLGAAPVLKDSKTYVPIEMFGLLLGEDTYTVKDYSIIFNTEENVQIPNPIVEYKTVDEAKKAVKFAVSIPTAIPSGYELEYVSVISNEIFQLTFKNGENEICYRTAEGKDDISGDYNIYSNTKTLKINNLEITAKGNDDLSNAVWCSGDLTYSIYANKALTEKELTDIIANIK